jgi:acyl-CoA reductase-like NAD-dependent aldehyde dehydrogenase
VITQEAAQHVKGQIDRSIEMGARCLAGGEIRRRQLFLPTVFVDATLEMPVMEEEVFGPVIPIWPLRTMEEAIRLAKRAISGLQASIMARDITAALRFA